MNNYVSAIDSYEGATGHSQILESPLDYTKFVVVAWLCSHKKDNTSQDL